MPKTEVKKRRPDLKDACTQYFLQRKIKSRRREYEAVYLTTAIVGTFVILFFSARDRSCFGNDQLRPGYHQLHLASRRSDRCGQLRFCVGNLRSGEQELPARLSTDAGPHRLLLLLLLQERHAASRPLTH